MSKQRTRRYGVLIDYHAARDDGFVELETRIRYKFAEQEEAK